ncbi:MAG: hypothetical protein J6Q96_01150 [Bacteroidales bacterium]|nr:hypothetical protein [Bacteroidales bacterium]
MDRIAFFNGNQAYIFDRKKFNRYKESKEYYNKKIGELYAVMENQEKIIRDLQEEKQQIKERINKAIEYLKGCGIDKEIMEVCQNYDINGIEMMQILEGAE